MAGGKHRKIIRPRLAALAMAALAVCPAAPAQAGHGFCPQIAARIRALPTAHDISDPIWRLPTQGDNSLVIDNPQRETEVDIARFVGGLQRDGAGPGLIRQVKTFVDWPPPPGPYLRSMFTLKRFGRTSLTTLEDSDAGDLHCVDYLFYRQAAGGHPPRRLPAPSQARPAAFCLSSLAYVGAFAGRAVFITDKYLFEYPDYDIRVSAWTGRRWTQPCRLRAVYSVSFRVDHFHCRGEACPALKALAPTVARRFANTAHAQHAFWGVHLSWGPPLTPADRARFEAMRRLFPGDADPPTFGEPDSSMAFIRGDVATIPLRLKGHLYLAAMSHPFGPYEFGPDVTLAVYDLKGAALIPVAGVSLLASQERLVRISRR